MTSLRHFTNTWECDENGHMNVQFYFRRFEEAGEIFVRGNALSPSDSSFVKLRHVRYHRELHAGDSSIIESSVITKGDNIGCVQHLMFNSVRNELCTTALDFPQKHDFSAQAENISVAEAAMPRSVASGLSQSVNSSHLLANGQAFVAGQSLVRRADCDHMGDIFSSRIISRFTDGAPHVWDHAGITTDWLNKTNNGRVAVEMKLTRLGAVAVGDCLKMISWISDIKGKTFMVSHQLEKMESGEPVVRGDVRCLVMNLQTRKAVELPPFFLEKNTMAMA